MTVGSLLAFENQIGKGIQAEMVHYNGPLTVNCKYCPCVRVNILYFRGTIAMYKICYSKQ